MFDARLAFRSLAAYRVARRAAIPGMGLDHFGRRLGVKLLLRGRLDGVMYVLHPIDIVRYFEFDFAVRSLPPGCRRALDVASPRLLSLFVASASPSTRIDVINPDAGDAEYTARIARAASLTNVSVRPLAIEELPSDERYHCAWTLSVLEHISGDDGDRRALEKLHDRLEPGGVLVITLPVARKIRIEYRDTDVYGIGTPQHAGRFFFQRVYDERALQRLLDSIPWASRDLRWFGERTPGWFAAYEQRWVQRGLDETIDDPRYIAEQFREYASWQDMPGDGVCGIALRK